ncbi:MAG: amidase [Acidobacteria bacterium]|nr:amidase [Acidobacteriota bacterium]
MSSVITRRALFAGAAAAAARNLFAAEELTSLTIGEAASLVRKKAVSPVELVKACLARMEALNPKLNAFITVTGESALAQAKQLEAEAAKGAFRSPLHGVPIALKDNIDVQGVRTTAGSAILADNVAREDADVTRRLKAAGAVLLGKLNMHEFAIGGTTVVSYFGPVKNPWKLAHHPGGSSGGSGAAVASQMCYGALGTDTGGSIRGPAAYCGIAGLKPTYGRVSIRGVIPMCWSLDHVGPMCRTAGDCALMLGAIAGYDPLDTTSVDHPVDHYMSAIGAPVSRFRLGIPHAVFYDKLHEEISKAMEAAIEVLRKLTASTVEAPLPQMAGMHWIGNAEIYAYHADQFARTPNLYQPQTRRSIERGKQAGAAEYLKARREVDLLRRTIPAVFEHLDVLVTPTNDKPPETIEEALKRAASETPPPIVLSSRSPFNILGLPTISVPCGFTSDGLPIGMQISGAPWAEAKVLALAHAYEQATRWHLRKQPLA